MTIYSKDDSDKPQSQFSQINLVDLAGAEAVTKTHSEDILSWTYHLRTDLKTPINDEIKRL